MKATILLRQISALRAITSLVFACVISLGGMSPPAHAEVSVAVEFRTPLEAHGQWTHNDRWGDVWTPGHIDKDWAPYTRGRWAYTDDWGWYWVSDESEADWGWAVYHYGRWFFDSADGWIWVPGREWAPAWVSWRRGAHRIGWAPQPPDEIFVEIRDDPHYWVFVEPRNFVSERVWVNIEPGWHQTALLQETVIVNRTVVIRERGFAVNPGIEPAVIAHEVGRPIHAYEVSPVVLEGTADIEGAIKVRADEAPAKAKVQRVEQTSNVIEPAKTVEAPQALAPDENGRLGERPPEAAKAEKEEPGKPKTAEETKPGEKNKTVEQGGFEQPGKPKAAEETKPGEKNKRVEQGGPEQPGKPKAAEEPKPGEKKKNKTVEPGGPEQPGKPKASEKAKPGESGKTVEQDGPEQPGKAAEEATPGKKGKTVEGEAKQLGKGAEELKEDKKATKQQPAPRAAEEAKPGKKGKTAEQSGPEEKPGQKAEQQGKPKPNKKAAKEGEPEHPL
jgi:hypothetical protein